MRWNDKRLEKHFNRIINHALEKGFTEEELKYPYLDGLSRQTKSQRIMRMITLAYYLGELKGIREIDEGKTLITFR